MRLICCGAGELLLRSCFWTWWYIGAAVPKLVETVCFVLPVYVIEALLLHQWAEMLAGALFGTLLSYSFFLPLATDDPTRYPSGVCSVYVCMFSWVAGAFVTSFVVDIKLIEPFRHRWMETSCKYRRVRSGAWLGLAMGLSFAFSLTSIARDSQSTQTFDEWCRPHPAFPLPLLAVPIAVFGAMAHLVHVPLANVWAQRLGDYTAVANPIASQRAKATPEAPSHPAPPTERVAPHLYAGGIEHSYSSDPYEYM